MTGLWKFLACDALLTPPSTLGALRAGYRPVLHPSIDAMQTATADA